MFASKTGVLMFGVLSPALGYFALQFSSPGQGLELFDFCESDKPSLLSVSYC